MEKVLRQNYEDVKVQSFELDRILFVLVLEKCRFN